MTSEIWANCPKYFNDSFQDLNHMTMGNLTSFITFTFTFTTGLIYHSKGVDSVIKSQLVKRNGHVRNKRHKKHKHKWAIQRKRNTTARCILLFRCNRDLSAWDDYGEYTTLTALKMFSLLETSNETTPIRKD